LSAAAAASQAARLWVHECERVFRDRMVNDTDMAKFDEFRAAVTKKYFEDLGLSSVEERPLLFTSFMQVRLGLHCRLLCCVAVAPIPYILCTPVDSAAMGCRQPMLLPKH
jgi:hypothetical protein